MTDEKKPQYLEDLVLYQYADVALRLASDEKNAPFAKGALEKLCDKFGEVLGDKKGILDGFKEGALVSEQGINTAINNYSGKYQKALGSMDITEFYNVRSGILKSVLGEDEFNKSKEVFEKYKGQKVSSITDEVEQAQARLQDKKGLNFNEKQKEEAKKILEKLAPIYSIIQFTEKRNYEELMNGATKNTYKELISEALKKA